MGPLYEEMMVDCVLMDKVRTPDGLGGWTTAWADRGEFKAAIDKDNTIQARIAEAQGIREVYTVTASRSVPLEFHDVIRRVSDGQIFRVTSNMKDNMSPTFSGINFGQVTAEAWVLE